MRGWLAKAGTRSRALRYWKPKLAAGSVVSVGSSSMLVQQAQGCRGYEMLQISPVFAALSVGEREGLIEQGQGALGCLNTGVWRRYPAG